MEFRADLTALNDTLYGENFTGTATFQIEGDSLTIRVNLGGVPADMMHLQHLHGKQDGSEADCPTQEADQNDDGIVDLIETREQAGITMIPLHDDHVSLEIKTETYPVAESDGTYSYEQTVSVSALNAAVQQEYRVEEPKLEKMVIFIHGVEEGQVPESAQSLPEVPAHVTVPIACGEINLVSYQP